MTAADTDSQRIDEMLAAFPQRCTAAGLAATTQRRTVYECLARSLDHPTAEALYERVKGRLPGVSLATVYRNLRLFVAAGFVDEVATGASLSRFDANQTRHHHLICTVCGSVRDYYSDALDGMTAAVRPDERFEVREAKVNIFGHCADCRPPASSIDPHG
jgi:Fur family peroxide stress response transcriptional regulator